MSNRPFIIGMGLLSPAGADFATNLRRLQTGEACFENVDGRPVGRLHPDAEAAVTRLRAVKEWRAHDRAVLLGVLAARQSIATVTNDLTEWAVVTGSSRGATASIEQAVLRHDRGETLSALTSPMTTAGAFSAAIARDQRTNGLALSVSAACATGLHAIGMAALLIRSGQAPGAIAGGSEAAITPFTMNILQAARVYSRTSDEDETRYPCRPMHPSRSGLVMGEGAAMIALANEPSRSPSVNGVGQVVVSGYGAATEPATLTGISREGGVLCLAIARALHDAGLQPADVGLIVGHGAGTLKGDAAELQAYQQAFREVPPLVLHKWLTGHMLAASPGGSVAFAVSHLSSGTIPAHPYFAAEASPLARPHSLLSRKAEHAIVCALGFGGNAAVIVLSRAH